MSGLKHYEFWFLTGSQHLYGEETLKQVAEHSEVIVKALNASSDIPCTVVYKSVLTTPDEITNIIREANHDNACAGIITWMHTFSPSKMWINGLSLLQKPFLHLHTQFNRQIPNLEIDMDFMNLNQSAHGDREHGFIGARMRLARKVVVGYWQDSDVHEKIGSWMRTAVGASVSKSLKVMRFGDNMRQVAVTEGDKVEAQIKLGWQVNTTAVGDLAQAMAAIPEAEVEAVYADCIARYTLNTEDIASVKYQVREELAMHRLLSESGCQAFTTNFEDLHGLEQLPGFASQRLMEDGYGFGAEGDWKTAAMVHILKMMGTGLGGGTSLMEDYTYDLTIGNELILGAHMLEICPSVAAGKPKIEVHPLGIGGKNPPARLVFEGKAGSAIAVSLIDMGGRLRLIVNDCEAVKPIYEMPNLPVARVMWKPLPNLKLSAEAWILAGGAHHTAFSYDVTAEQMRDWAEMMDIEYVHIGKETDINALKQQLLLSDMVWKLKA